MRVGMHGWGKWRGIRRRREAKPDVVSAESEATAGETWDPVRHTLHLLSERIHTLAVEMEKAHLDEYVQLAQRPWVLIWRNLLYGTVRGVGIALGFTFFAGTIVWLLQILGRLNLPIVGDYIADIVRIVQRQLQIKPF